jgi:hypothetical protein
MPDAIAKIKETAMEQCATKDRSKNRAAMDSTDTLIHGVKSKLLSITSVSAVSEDFEDACAVLPAVSTEPATEREFGMSSDARNLVEDVGKSMVKDYSDVGAVHKRPVDGEGSEKMGHMDQTDIQMTTVREAIDISPQALVTTGIPIVLNDGPDDSDDTATIVHTPDRSANSTTYAGSADGCVEQNVQASNIQVPATDEHPLNNQENGLQDSEVDASTEPLSEQTEQTSESSTAFKKTTALTTAGNPPIAPVFTSQKFPREDDAGSASIIGHAAHISVESETDLEGPAQVKVIEHSATDSRKSGSSEPPTGYLEHNRDSSGEITEPESIEEDGSASEESRKGVNLLAAAVRSIPPHLRQLRPTPQQYTAPAARVGNFRTFMRNHTDENQGKLGSSSCSCSPHFVPELPSPCRWQRTCTSECAAHEDATRTPSSQEGECQYTCAGRDREAGKP